LPLALVVVGDSDNDPYDKFRSIFTTNQDTQLNRSRFAIA
jgi:hypothetical protein